MLNQEEIDIYDRQIRIWGHEVQKKLKNYNILFVGLSGVGWEVAKNLILYGIKSLTILETENVNVNDLSTNLFLTSDNIGQNKAEASLPSLKKLNPNVNITLCTDLSKLESTSFLKEYDLVVMNNLPFYMAKDLNKKLHNLGIHSIYTRCFNIYGLVCYDFVSLESSNEDEKSQEKNSTITNKVETIIYPIIETLFEDPEFTKKLMLIRRSLELKNLFIAFKVLLSMEDNIKDKNQSEIMYDSVEYRNEIKNLCEKLNFKSIDIFDDITSKSEFNPTCAVLAGFLCQELIKVLSCSRPAGNIMLYNGDLYKADTLQFFK